MIHVSVTLTLRSGNSRIVSEMLGAILISSSLFQTSNIPWDNFNSMTKQDLCPSEVTNAFYSRMKRDIQKEAMPMTKYSQ